MQENYSIKTYCNLFVLRRIKKNKDYRSLQHLDFLPAVASTVTITATTVFNVCIFFLRLHYLNINI